MSGSGWAGLGGFRRAAGLGGFSVRGRRDDGAMTTQTAPRPELPARRGVLLPADLRQQRCDVARWALEHGRPLNLDAITVVLGAKRFESTLDGRPFTRWTSAGVLTFLLGSATEWMSQQCIERPDSFGETLYSYLSYLGDRELLSSGSSEHHLLLAAVADTTGLSRAGRDPRGRNPSQPIALLKGSAIVASKGVGNRAPEAAVVPRRSRRVSTPPVRG